MIRLITRSTVNVNKWQNIASANDGWIWCDVGGLNGQGVYNEDKLAESLVIDQCGRQLLDNMFGS